MYEDLITVYPKPYCVYIKGTVVLAMRQGAWGSGCRVTFLGVWDSSSGFPGAAGRVADHCKQVPHGQKPAKTPSAWDFGKYISECPCLLASVCSVSSNFFCAEVQVSYMAMFPLCFEAPN